MAVHGAKTAGKKGLGRGTGSGALAGSYICFAVKRVVVKSAQFVCTVALKVWWSALRQVLLRAPSGKGSGRCLRTQQVQQTQMLRRSPLRHTL